MSALIIENSLRSRQIHWDALGHTRTALPYYRLASGMSHHYMR